jgi:hypothetical protein
VYVNCSSIANIFHFNNPLATPPVIGSGALMLSNIADEGTADFVLSQVDNFK